MRYKSGSVLRFLKDNKLANNDTFYIDIVRCSYAQNLKELQGYLGIA